MFQKSNANNFGTLCVLAFTALWFLGFGYTIGKQTADRYYAKHVRIEIIGGPENGATVLCYSTDANVLTANGDSGCTLGTMYDAEPHK